MTRQEWPDNQVWETFKFLQPLQEATLQYNVSLEEETKSIGEEA